jgi:hypothetical protein
MTVYVDNAAITATVGRLPSCCRQLIADDRYELAPSPPASDSALNGSRTRSPRPEEYG